MGYWSGWGMHVLAREWDVLSTIFVEAPRNLALGLLKNELTSRITHAWLAT